MRIARWQGAVNYGDMLNEYIWPKVLHRDLPTILPAGMLYGIGTILGPPERMPKANPHLVFGAGAGYLGPPHFTEPSEIRFVRGPLTAKLYNGVPHITDPAILVSQFFTRNPAPSVPCAFMPRWNSISSDLFSNCDKAGIGIIDPRWPVPQVTEAIADTELLLTEALHGAVVADALRVPWVCIRVKDHSDFKWFDWCGSMNMVWNHVDAATQGLTWARSFAVPQLSAKSVLDAKLASMQAAVAQLNHDISERKGIFA